MKVLVIALTLPLLLHSYTKYSATEALTECTRCLETPENRFCTDGTDYYCCDMAENSSLCDPQKEWKIITGGKSIRCSHTRYREGLNKYRFCP